jgi:glycosyltransferase involved in cell wall biosynthesis
MVVPHMAHSRLLSIVKGEKKGDEMFRIVHCGSVSKPRNPEIFIKALSKMVSGLGLTKKQLRCYFVGCYDSNLSEIIKNNKVEDIVELLPPKQYAESLSFISPCDMALIIEAECEEGIYLPTKFVDAIQSGLPVFCVSPFPGTLNDMVERYGVGYCADNTSVYDIEKKLKNAYKDFLNNNLPEMGKEKLGYFFEENIVSLLSAIIE